MNAPLVWIVLPGSVAILLFLMRRWSKAVLSIGAGLASALAWLAWQVPIGDPLEIGPWSLKFADTLTVLGRRFVLANPDRPVLVLVYLAAALWFAGAGLARPGDLFVPLGLGMVTLLTAALAVDPFLYAALFIETSALLSVPLLAVPGRPVKSGVMRFLTYQTLGSPFILFTGWMLAGVEASPADIELVVRASLMLGFGFAFLLAVFPFHSWIPILAGEIHPYSASFVFLLVLTLGSLFGLSFLDRFAWLRNSPGLFSLLRLAGVFMIVVGGVWAAFERHLGRVLGYAVIVEIGLTLMAIGLGRGQGIVMYFGLMPTRIIALLLWSQGLTALQRHHRSLQLRSLSGAGRQMPWVTGGILLAHLTLAGFPLLAGFPTRIALWTEVATLSPWLALGASVGSIGLAAAAARALHEFLQPNEQVGDVKVAGGTLEIVNFAGLVVLIFFGLFPQTLTPFITALAQVFPNMAR